MAPTRSLPPTRRTSRARPSFLRFAVLAAALSALGYVAGRIERSRRIEPTQPPVKETPSPLPSLLEAAGQQEEAWRRFPAETGERLVYGVEWGLISVGEVTLHVSEEVEHHPFRLSEKGRSLIQSRVAEIESLRASGALKGADLEKAVASCPPPSPLAYPEGFGRKVMRIQATAKASSLINAIYKVDYKIESLVDAEGTYSWCYDERVVEGRRNRDNLIEFDQRNHAAYYFRRKNQEKEYAFNAAVARISDRVQDPLSILYYVRLLRMSVGQAVNITVHIDNADWPTLLEVIGTEKVRTGAGELDCLVIRPRYEYQGLFAKSSEPRVWLERESRIPVKMDVKIPVGSVKVLLKEWSRPGKEGRGK